MHPLIQFTIEDRHLLLNFDCMQGINYNNTYYLMGIISFVLIMTVVKLLGLDNVVVGIFFHFVI